MEFPIFQVPLLGNGLAIALDAVLHVILSHGFAIGAFSFVLASEWLAWRHGRPDLDAFAYGFLKWLAIIITAVGAITGVGIWFFISALEPRGTASMLRVFFGPWFIEWGVFTGEVITLLIYYFAWPHWTGKKKPLHMAIGGVHTFFALMSAVLITGMLGFMLTSDAWPWTQNFFEGYFNRTFLPQLVLRIAIAFTLGSVVTLAYTIFSRQEEPMRRQVMRAAGWVALAGILVALPAGLWYFSQVPDTFKVHANFAVLTSALSQRPDLFYIINGVILALLALLIAFALARRPRLARIVVLPVFLGCLVMIAEFERTREFIRGPYVMPGYMYANQVTLAETDFYNQHGLLPNSYWYTATVQQNDITSQGAYLFGQNCSVCHSIGGMNDIALKVRGRSQDGILAIINHTNEMVPFMTPFSGSPEERAVLARFLYQLSTGAVDVGQPSRFMDVH